MMIGSKTLILVDTPGFDDTNLSDFQVLQSIASWLETTCERGQLLSGVLYLHRITNTRIEGSARRALHLFQRICGEDNYKNVSGEDNYKNVILATTFWNKIEHCKEDGVERENRLLANEGFWKSMKDRGAQTMRLGRNYEDIVPALIEMAAKPKVTLDIQKELGDGLSLEQTMAGLFVRDDSKSINQEHEAQKAKMQKDFARGLDQQQNKIEAARQATKQKKLLLEQQASLAKIEKQKQLMEHQVELYRLNQRIKQAEIRSRLREEQDLEAREREHEQQVLASRRAAQERESRQRYGLSLTQ